MTSPHHDEFADGAADEDLLAPPPSNGLLSVGYIASELRRHRRAIVALAIVGMLAGLLLGRAVPQSKSATATLYLDFPPTADLTTSMDTEIALLLTRPVEEAAEAKLGPERFTMPYRGTALSPKVMGITARGPDAATAERRADALAESFLAFRKQNLDRQLNSLVTTARSDEDKLATLSPLSPGYQDLLKQKNTDNGRVNELRADTNAMIQNSYIVDRAYTPYVSTTKTAVKNAASGLVAGLAIGLGWFTFLAIITTRVRRRSDVAAALRAPVVLSVGKVVPTGWRRLIPRRRGPARRRTRPEDLQLIVRHLRRSLSAAPTQDLVVLAIDNLEVVTPCVTALQRQLETEGQRVRIVNETGRPLSGGKRDRANTSADSDVNSPADVVIVLALLDPAEGAEHLREWAGNMVAFVTAGRSTATKLESHGVMLRSAGLDLSSVVLIDSDRSDDTLGIYEQRSDRAGTGPNGVYTDDSPSAHRSV